MTVLHRLIYSLNIASECGSPAAVYLASFAGIVYSAGDQPQVTIPNLPFTIYQPQFTKYNLSATIYQAQVTSNNLPATLDHAQFPSHNYQPQYTRNRLPQFVRFYQITGKLKRYRREGPLVDEWLF